MCTYISHSHPANPLSGKGGGSVSRLPSVAVLQNRFSKKTQMQLSKSLQLIN